MKKIVIGPHVVEWVAKRTNEHGNFGAAIGIGLEQDGQLIAGVAFSDWNGVNVSMHVASDGSRRWLSREYLYVCFDYAFRTAGVRRITGLVGEGNAEARRFDEHIGFKEEARLKGAHPTGDLIVYAMWRHECRWLKLKDRKHEVA
jgi:RimJ/RimL family protein N-acetyltransferase